ncbi:type IV secretory system conjugative DNA transfer family protein [Embleya sp. NPDC059237]|uniref:type IV secretory system conjugative DNA transfer family protein n=1 Tax=Embleya sp. NPDC059237 TaxID=3346784 RepID=UPI00369767B4
MSATNKKRGPNPYGDLYLLMGVVGVLMAATGAMWIGAKAATPAEQPAPPPPPLILFGLIFEKYTWPGTEATVIASLLGTLLAVLAAGATTLVVMVRRREIPIDRAIPYLAKPRDLRAVTTKGVRRKAGEFGVEPDEPPGLYIGKTVRHGLDVWGSWEDMHVDIWGPRTGKTTSRAIPNIVSAPGAVLVTSNKRDIVDATRASRARRGKVWVFDPQNQAGAKPTWYWDPLSYVGNSITLAVKLASRFAGINRPGHARSDAYFEPAAEDLIANLLLAASISNNQITQVFTWLTRPTDDTPERILREGGHPASADAVDSIINAPDRQRAGVYGTAAQIVSFLIAPTVTAWITPGDQPDRPAFDYKAFVRGGDTLYLLSEETNKMAAPLVVALTAALAEEAENYGRDCPGGRLPTPMLFVLDEAANVCPWKALPDKYSHFGSRGVVMMTILQSWAQGAAAWGDVGMAKLWGAANVRVYGGGVMDTKFLGDLSAASGIFEPGTTSFSRKSTDFFESNVSKASRSEAVLDVADLTSMPRGRAFVQFSGTKPALIRTIPWWETEYADEIRMSIAEFDPGSQNLAVELKKVS